MNILSCSFVYVIKNKNKNVNSVNDCDAKHEPSSSTKLQISSMSKRKCWQESGAIPCLTATVFGEKNACVMSSSWIQWVNNQVILKLSILIWYGVYIPTTDRGFKHSMASITKQITTITHPNVVNESDIYDFL